MIILSSTSQNIVKKAFRIKDESAGYYIKSIENNLDMLYYLAYLPEANALKERVGGNGNIKDKLMSRNFLDMMSEEILNELSNILNDTMQDIDDSDMASIKSYLYATVIPFFQNKFAQEI